MWHKLNRAVLVVILAMSSLIASSSMARAEIVLPNLPAGSQYQLVFVTRDAHDAVSTNIDEYNTFVSQQAALGSSLPAEATWRAIGSTSAVNAIDNAVAYDGIPIYDTHGNRVADGRTDLWDGSLQNPIAYDQYGEPLPLSDVYTGSSPYGDSADGQAYGALGQFQFGGGYWNVPLAGQCPQSGFGWIACSGRGFNTLAEAQAWALPFYGLSSPITVVPEPSSIVLLLVGVLGAAGYFWRRQRSV